MVMMYCRFPRVEAEDRLSRSAALDPAQIQIWPDRAQAAVHAPGAPSQIRLNLLDGRPVYRFAFGRRVGLVFADTGQRLDEVPQDMALRIAAAWTGFPGGSTSFQGLIAKDDEWTVYSSVRPYGPFWKYSWPNGEETHVSRSAGDVVQGTTRGSRIGAYAGAFGGATVYIARETPQKSRIIPLRGDPEETLAIGRILEVVKRAVSPAAIIETRLVEEYELYYLDRPGRLPLPALYVQLNDAARWAYYIDPKTGRVVQSYGLRSRWNRWLYHGLHSMDLPLLYARRPAWDILVIALLLGGMALCITSLLMAWKVIRRKLVGQGELPELQFRKGATP
jgi:hypothetical protein